MGAFLAGDPPIWREVRLRQGLKRCAAQLGPRLKAFLGKPALVDLQHIAHGLVRAVRFGGLRLHVFEVYDGAVVGDEGGGQRYQGVFHPKTLLALGLEHKQHSFLLPHLGAKHQPRGVLLGGLRNLRLNLVNSNG